MRLTISLSLSPFLAAVAFVATGTSACGLFSSAECATDDDCHGSKVCSAEGVCVECNTDEDCGARELCVEQVCERGGVEGEGEGDAGEGEGDAGEGEGDAGEGEGDAGEGEGDAGEGEGEGEGDVPPGPNTVIAEIRWDSTTADVDIHFTKKDAQDQFCVDIGFGSDAVGPTSSTCSGAAPLDCYYGDCRNDFVGATLPQWDDAAGNTPGDPVLELDDLNGEGPERISVQALPAGDFLFGAHFYSAGQSPTTPNTTVTGKLFFGTGLTARFSKTVPFDGTTTKWVDLAIIRNGTGTPCFEDLTDGDAHDDCG